MAISEQQLQSDLLSAGVIRAVGLMSLIALVAVCHIYADKIQIALDEQQRVVIRTILYIVAITTFPVMKFVRHVLLRLNQTMSGNKSPKSRYMLTIIISMLVAESIGIYGFVMYILGDSYNTLYIFIMLSALAMFLYKPDQQEYKTLV
ncbi:MAG: hypothetical protein GQ529_03885, partial [Methyloprofundus sp.]|nr:hypothetical protein [Methyloprofundus sp.]